MTTPIYQTITFCRKPETLWGKLESGGWDWLGVHPNGQYVLGSPAAAPSGARMRAALDVLRAGVTEAGVHGVKVAEPEGPAGDRWCATPEEAEAEFHATLKQLAQQEGPRLYRVRLIQDREERREDFVVTRPPTYRGAK